MQGYEPWGLFYTVEKNKDSNTIYIGIDNSDGHCWVEEFYSIGACRAWLRGESEKSPLTRYQRIKDLSVEEIADLIIDHSITDDFCKSDCKECKAIECECLHDLECCIKWLNEVEE